MVIIHIFFQNPNLWNTLKKFATASIKSTAPQKLNRSCFKPKHVWKIRIIFRSPKPTNVAFHSQFCISPSFESPFGSQQEAPPDLNNVKPPINDLVEISGHNFGDGIELLKVKVLWQKKQLGSICRWLLHWWIYHGILPLRNQGLARTCQVPTYENNRSTSNKSFGDETNSSHNVIPQNVMLVGFQNPQRYYS